MKGQDFLSDISKIIGGASGSLIGVKDDIRKNISNKIDSLLREYNFVTREEFEVLKKMVTNLQKENEELKKQITPFKQNPETSDIILEGNFSGKI